MEAIKLVILSVVQGISELLPISSSGHLIITSELLNIHPSTLLLTTLHIGTSLAILAFFAKKLFKGFFTKQKWSFYIKILVSVIPAGVLGILFETKIENLLRANWIIALSLIFWGILMIFAQKARMGDSNHDWEKITWKQSILMGLAQAIALIPGTSRSGVTTLAGVALGLDQYTALSYSFILGLPVLLGSSLWEIAKAVISNPNELLHLADANNYFNIAVVVLIPFLFGIIALMILERTKRDKWLSTFGIYRIIVGIAILVVSYIL